MQWDLGWLGAGVLAAMAVGYGVFVQLLFLNTPYRWLGAIGAVAFFVAGILVSEGLFGWATAAELQPNIDGLSFDEVLLSYVIAVPIALLGRSRVPGERRHTPVHR
jgi:hypothetical protein